LVDKLGEKEANNKRCSEQGWPRSLVTVERSQQQMECSEEGWPQTVERRNNK